MSSAAAVCQRAYWSFAKATDQAKADRCAECTFTILDTLLGPEFLGNETPGWEGILKHGIYH